MSFSLLHTKLHSPQASADLIDRPHLFEQLELGATCKLTLIAAPAGYGKSSLAISWLKTRSRPAAWLSLDEQDNDLNLFLAYFVTAIQTLFPNECSQTVNLLQSQQSVPPEHLTNTLINEFAALPDTFILVLDDYHFINQEPIHHFMNTVVSQMPASMQLVIISRETPPLHVPRLRANRAILEIRPNDLRFSTAEAGFFLERFLGTPLSSELVEILTSRTEGWIVGLQLAAFSMRNQTDYRPFVESLQGTNRYIMEYLLDEILIRQSPEIQDFLLKTSILNRFCGPLCDAVTGNDDLVCNGQVYLDWLHSVNFLLVPLDEVSYWYRHHHLFRDLLNYKLRGEMNQQEISALHASAANWLVDNDLIDEALIHLLAAGDTLGAAQIVERNRHRLLDKDEWRTLDRWLTLLPPNLLQEWPGLLIAQAQILLFVLKVQPIPSLVEAAERLLQAPSLSLTPREVSLISVEIDVIKGILEYWKGRVQRSFDHLQRALRQVPPDHGYLRGTTIIYFCLAAQMTGQREMALQAAANALQNEATPDGILTVRALAAQSFVYLISGQLAKFGQLTEQTLKICEQHNYVHLLTWEHYLLGHIHYIWNNLEAAASHLEWAVERRYNLNTRAAIDSLAILTLTYQATQQPAKANKTIELLFDFALQSENPGCMAVAHSCQARLLFQQGDLENATGWLQTADISSDFTIFSVWLETPQLSYCRLLIVQGTSAALQEAVEKLQVHLKNAEDTYNTRFIIEILILQSLAYLAQTQVDKALATLKRAVVLAQPGGFIRTFVDCGLPVANLLRQLANQGVAPDYVNKILAAFPGSESQVDNEVPSGYLRVENKEIVNTQETLRQQFKNEDLIEPLTNRELEILELLAAQLSNQEIAQSLNVSIPTVKSHNLHIFQKMGAKSRYQAVAKAKTLNLLPADNGKTNR